MQGPVHVFCSFIVQWLHCTSALDHNLREIHPAADPTAVELRQVKHSCVCKAVAKIFIQINHVWSRSALRATGQGVDGWRVRPFGCGNAATHFVWLALLKAIAVIRHAAEKAFLVCKFELAHQKVQGHL